MATEDKRVESAAQSPAYVTYQTFENFLKSLHETGVPSRIDKSVLSKMSGSSQSSLITSLRWLRLIDAGNAPTDQLKQLVQSYETTDFPLHLKSVLRGAYDFMDAGRMSLENGTGKQLEAVIREYGVTGHTIIKCVTFFIAAARAAQIALGPHIKPPKVSGGGIAKRKQKKPLAGEQAEAFVVNTGARPALAPDASAPPPGWVKIPIPIKGLPDGSVLLPDNMTTAQWRKALAVTKYLLETYLPEEE